MRRYLIFALSLILSSWAAVGRGVDQSQTMDLSTPDGGGGIQRVVVAGSENSFTFAVIDFTLPASPRVVRVNPGFGGGCRVAIDSTNAVAGNVLGGHVRLIDVSNPGSPALRGMISTVLNGVGAIAIRGSYVAVAEQNAHRVALIDFSQPMSPSLLSLAPTPQAGGFNSLAFTDDYVVVGGGPNNCTTKPKYHTLPPIGQNVVR